MALNLSTLTSPATSDDVLAEVLTTADFLEPVPVLRNLARGSNAGGDAKQDVALNQPKALPLIENPAGDLGGYLYIPDVAGNYAEGPSVTIGSNETWEGELDMVITQWPTSTHILPMGGGDWNLGFGLIFYPNRTVRLFSKGAGKTQTQSGVTSGTPFNAKYGFDGANLYVDIDGTRVYTTFATDQSGSITHNLELNQQTLAPKGNYAIQKAKLTVNNAVVFDCDFNGSTSIRHGDTKFQAAVGGDVTINQSGNDPATIIKKPVLRFVDTAGNALRGMLGQTLSEGYLFAAFSVLGDGGVGSSRIVSFNSTGQSDTTSSSYIAGYAGGTGIYSYRSDHGNITEHVDIYDEANGDFLFENKFTPSTQLSMVNNADSSTNTVNLSGVSIEEFNIASNNLGAENAAIDLEYLALFPASITDAQADDVRKYINNRNTVFLRHDTDGYYFYNPQDLSSGAVTTWNGRIVGSDNGDADKNATQSTSADQPTSDGYKVTFADNTDHFDIPSTTQAGWQVVGTSFGTFAYKVNANAVTELNLLGNAGFIRKAGDLYGIILLPESATGREINEANKLLTDRGASESATADVTSAWQNRSDIVQFDGGDMSDVTNAHATWANCSSLESFNTELPSVENASIAWYGCSSLTSFNTSLPSATNVSNAWRNCSSLESFNTPLPLVTTAVEAWRSCTSLESFNTPLPSVTNAIYAWTGCNSLTSFSTSLPLVTNASSAWRGCSSLTSFDTPLPSVTNLSSAFQECTQLAEIGQLQTSNVTTWYYSFYNCRSLLSFPVLDTSSGTDFFGTWRNCSGLTQFPLLDCNLGRRFAWTWQGCSSLEDFPAGFFDNWNPLSISNEVFQNAWNGCSSLTAQSVENILTSIDASGKYATSDGTSGGTALADAGIDIDYNGDPLSAATTAAIDSLSGKGWQVYINGELVIPNILDLQPAAAYSLRSFDADADPNVVNVRRSSDGATSDFTASEVSDGTLRDWTLGDTLALDGQRMYFDGVDDYVDLNQSFIPATGDFSISFKYAHEEQTTSNRYILSQGNSNATFFGLSINNDTVDCRVAGGGAGTGVFGVTPISKGSVYEFKVTRVGDVFTLYVDGVSVGTQTNVGLTISTNTNTYIGQATWTGSRFTKGTAYDIKKDGTIYYKGYGNTNADWTDQVGSNDATVYGSPALYSGQGFDGHVTTWYDQRQIVETGDAYGTTISGTVDGSTATYNQIAPAVAGEFYRVRFTASNVNPRGRIRFRNYASNADVTATAGLASMTYFNADGDYESYVPSDDGLGLWFLADAGQSFDYSGVSVQQVAEVPNNASQSTASAQPKIVDAGTLVTEGGLAALDFDGADDYFQLTSNVFAEQLEVALVNHLEENATKYQRLINLSNGTDDDFMVVKTNGEQLCLRTGSTESGNTSKQFGSVAINNHNLLYVTSTLSTDSYTASVDGTSLSQATGQVLASGSFSISTIGARSDLRSTSFSEGTFQEIVVFNTDQSTNRTGIENNINDHFDIYS